MRLAQLILKRKFPSVDKPLQKKASQKYKPRDLFSEFYGSLVHIQVKWWCAHKNTAYLLSVLPALLWVDKAPWNMTHKAQLFEHDWTQL